MSTARLIALLFVLLSAAGLVAVRVGLGFGRAPGVATDPVSQKRLAVLGLACLPMLCLSFAGYLFLA